jgi:hypothetical protein
MTVNVLNRQSRQRIVLATAAITIVVVIVGLVLYFSGHFPFLGQKKFTPSITGNSMTKGEPHTTNQAAGQSTSSAGDNGPQGKDQGNSATSTLVAPSGNFVSNHHPHLSDNPAGSAYLASVCTTTPGASCKITFTQNSVTKSLQVETTDAGGSAYWNSWKLQDYGLTAGSWKIQAVATLGSQTKTSDDALTLDVTQ